MGMPHFIALCFIALHKYFIFTNLRFVATLGQASISVSFSNIICSLHVSLSYFDNSCNIWNFLPAKRLQLAGGSDDGWKLLAIKCLKINVCTFVFFSYNAIVHNRLQCSTKSLLYVLANQENSHDLLHCNIWFIVMLWNWTRNISKVYLYAQDYAKCCSKQWRKKANEIKTSVFCVMHSHINIVIEIGHKQHSWCEILSGSFTEEITEV